MSAIDLLVTENDDILDLSIAGNGDLATTDGFDTTLLMSIYAERRADSSQVIQPERRRGWWGNLLNDVQGFQIGSLLWLLYQSRLTQSVVINAEDYVREALEWMLDDNILRKVSVEASIVGQTTLSLRIQLVRLDNSIDTRLYNAWEATE